MNLMTKYLLILALALAPMSAATSCLTNPETGKTEVDLVELHRRVVLIRAEVETYRDTLAVGDPSAVSTANSIAAALKLFEDDLKLRIDTGQSTAGLGDSLELALEALDATARTNVTDPDKRQELLRMIAMARGALLLLQLTLPAGGG